MRIMLTKKMNPQKSSRSPSTKKYIEDYRPKSEAENEPESRDKIGEGSKWDKTDSECEFCLHLYYVYVRYKQSYIICMTNNLSILVCSYCSRDLDTAQVHQELKKSKRKILR